MGRRDNRSSTSIPSVRCKSLVIICDADDFSVFFSNLTSGRMFGFA